MTERLLALVQIFYENEEVEHSYPRRRIDENFNILPVDYELNIKPNKKLLSDKAFLDSVAKETINLFPEGCFTGHVILDRVGIDAPRITERYLNSLLKKYHSNDEFHRTLLIAPNRIRVYKKQIGDDYEQPDGLTYKTRSGILGRSAIANIPYYYPNDSSSSVIRTARLSAHEIGHTFGLLHHEPEVDPSTLLIAKITECIMSDAFRNRIFCSDCYSELETVRNRYR